MMAAPRRFTLVQNEPTIRLFEEIWQEYPRLRGDTARTMRLALELMADSVASSRPKVAKTAPDVTPALPLDAPAEEFELDADIFSGVKI